MDKIRPPFLYDSLDVNNPNPNKDHSKPSRLDWKVIGCILLFVLILVVGLFIYVIRSLSDRAEYGDTISRVLLVGLNVATVLAIIAGLLGGVTISLKWLYYWAIKNNLVSLNHGPHYTAKSVNTQDYDTLFQMFATRLYDVMEERANKSIYQGIQTLTKDESKHIHMKKDGKEIPEGDTIDEELPITLALDTERQDE